MLTLKKNSTHLQLSPKTVITVNAINPAFDQESAYRVFTWPFKIPASDHNLSVLGHPNRLDIRSKKKYYDGYELIIENNHFENGRLVVENTNDDEIEMVFQTYEIEVLSDLENIKINEILDTITITQTVQPQSVWQLDAPPDRYTLIINDQSFSLLANSGEDYDDVVQFFIDEVNAIYPGAVTFGTPGTGEFNINGSAYDPFVIDFTFYEGMSLVSSTNVGEARQDNFQSYLSNLITTPVDSHGFPIVKNFTLYGNNNSLFKNYVNYYHDGTFLDNEEQLTKEWAVAYIPFVKLAYVFEKMIENTTLVGLSGEWWNLSDTGKIVINNNRTLDQVFYELYPSNVNNQYFNGGKSSFSLNDHVPEMTGRELLNAISEGLALFHRIEGNKLSINPKVNMLRKTPIDWTDRMEPQVSNNPSEEEGFYIEFTEDEKDTMQRSTQHLPYTSGDGVNRLTMPFGVPFEDTFPDTLHPDGNAWKMIIMSQIGSNTEGLGDNEYSLRLFFDHGIQDDAEGDDYWMSGYTDTDTQGNSIGTHTLTIGGTTGIFTTFFDGFVQLLDNDEVTLIMRLSIQDILQTKQWKNARRYLKTPKGTFIGVIKQIQFKATTNGINLSSVNFIKQ